MFVAKPYIDKFNPFVRQGIPRKMLVLHGVPRTQTQCPMEFRWLNDRHIGRCSLSSPLNFLSPHFLSLRKICLADFYFILHSMLNLEAIPEILNLGSYE